MDSRVFLFLFFVFGFGNCATVPDGASTLDSVEIIESTTESDSPSPSDLAPADNPSVAPLENRYTFHLEARSWIEALLSCWQEGKELAVPSSPQEAQALSELLFQNAPFVQQRGEMSDAVHVGIHRLSQSRPSSPSGNYWETMRGKKLSASGYNQWIDGGTGYCGALFADGRFFAQPCETQLAFICQTVEKNSLLSGNYTLIPGVGLFRLHTSPQSWSKAQKKCEAEGGALAVPRSPRFAGLLAGALLWHTPSRSERTAGCFIGANDVADEGEWMTESGLTLEQIGYESWRPNQPSGNRSENCVVLMEDGLYEDYPCISPLPFCCELQVSLAGTSKTVFDSGRFRLHTERVNWWEAVFRCHEANMTLATLEKLSEETLLKDIMQRARSVLHEDLDTLHIGIHNMNEEKTWKTLDGHKIQYANPYGHVIQYNDGEDRTPYTYRVQNENGACGFFSRNGIYFSDCFDTRPYICALY